jgi:hypothetical protein
VGRDALSMIVVWDEMMRIMRYEEANAVPLLLTGE